MEHRIRWAGTLLSALAVAGLVAILAGCGDDAETTRAVRQSITRVIGNLQPATVLAQSETSEAPPRYALEDRMRHYGVPGVSVATARNGRLAWARAWGEAAGAEELAPGHWLAAAELSTVASAALALELVERGELQLDEDLRRRVASLSRLPQKVTLRHLLLQTSGLEPADAAGLPASTVVESVSQGSLPGTRSRFSAAGWAVLEYLVAPEDPQAFADLFAERVAAPLAEVQGAEVDAAFGDAAPGGVPAAALREGPGVREADRATQPLAVRGLWTTSEALLRLLLGVTVAPPEGGLLDGPLIERISSDTFADWGLGFEVDPAGEWIGRYGSFGAVVAHPRSGDAVAVLTNGGRGGALARELVLAVAQEFSWSGVSPERLETLPLDGRSAAALVGTYEVTAAPSADALVGQTAALSWSSAELSLAAPASFFPGGQASVVVLHRVRGGFRTLEFPGLLTMSVGQDGVWELRYAGIVARKQGAATAAETAASPTSSRFESSDPEEDDESRATTRRRGREPDDEDEPP